MVASGRKQTFLKSQVASTVYTTKALEQPVDEAEKMADAIIAQNLAH